MIGKIVGIVDSIESNYLIINVNGIGYIVHCSFKVLSQAQVNDTITLLVETFIKEEQILLYGFANKQEKACFSELITVKGVGPRIALLVLGKLSPDQICIAVNMKDRKTFAGISGVGPKIIDRMFTELKDRKFVNEFEKYFSSGSVEEISEVKDMRDDAVSVLINLGISKTEAFTTVSEIISKFPDYDLNQIIKASLSKMTVK